MKRLAGFLAAATVAAAFVCATPAQASGCSYGTAAAKLDVNHQYNVGPYAHGVTWENPNVWAAQRERLFVEYPGTTWTLVWDNIQSETPAPDWWGIIYTPSYRPADGRYWKIVLWGTRTAPGACNTTSNVVYN